MVYKNFEENEVHYKMEIFRAKNIIFMKMEMITFEDLYKSHM